MVNYVEVQCLLDVLAGCARPGLGGSCSVPGRGASTLCGPHLARCLGSHAPSHLLPLPLFSSFHLPLVLGCRLFRFLSPYVDVLQGFVFRPFHFVVAVAVLVSAITCKFQGLASPCSSRCVSDGQLGRSCLFKGDLNSPFSLPRLSVWLPLCYLRLWVLEPPSSCPVPLAPFQKLVNILTSILSRLFLIALSSAVELSCGQILPESETTSLSIQAWSGSKGRWSLLGPP